MASGYRRSGVFPTKKEGKYIVKLRESITEQVSELNEEKPEEINKQESTENEVKQTKPKIKLNSAKPSKARSAVNDSTINLEILEQLRNLGEELRNDRFKKEQKQYIKHVVKLIVETSGDTL